MSGDNRSAGVPWWVDGVIYQIYPRSFADANGDGIGDLAGVTAHLDHLEWLGVDAIWLNPITVSPNKDWGYDVADYCDVDPALGTLADFDELVEAARRREIGILMDLVPNHSSDQHPWFLDSRSSRDAEHRDWYVWADGDPPGDPNGRFPNNWQSSFGGPAWSFDEATGQWYLHHFVPEQPDLNWWNPGVVEEFDRILRFWFDRGAAGFRIDVCHMIVKDKELRDNPPVDFWLDHEAERMNAERPELHDVLRQWRRVAETYDPPRLLLGETYVASPARLARFYGEGDELQLAFNFPFFRAPFHAEPLRQFVDDTEAQLPAGAWPVWTGSNHDHSRFPTRWAQNDPRRIRTGMLMLLCLRGTPVLYYGDEIGMVDTPITYGQLQDPVGFRSWPERDGRDIARTPMQWHGGPGAGFTAPGVETWLPIGDADERNVALQRDDPDSTLSFCREVLALRRERDDLRRGDYRPLDAPDGVWVFARGEATTVALNLSAAPRVVTVPEGRILLSTVGRADETVGPELTLAPWEGVVVAAS
jgi:alpha-glucosidase